MSAESTGLAVQNGDTPETTNSELSTTIPFASLAATANVQGDKDSDKICTGAFHYNMYDYAQQMDKLREVLLFGPRKKFNIRDVVDEKIVIELVSTQLLAVQSLSFDITIGKIKQQLKTYPDAKFPAYIFTDAIEWNDLERLIVEVISSESTKLKRKINNFVSPKMPQPLLTFARRMFPMLDYCQNSNKKLVFAELLRKFELYETTKTKTPDMEDDTGSMRKYEQNVRNLPRGMRAWIYRYNEWAKIFILRNDAVELKSICAETVKEDQMRCDMRAPQNTSTVQSDASIWMGMSEFLCYSNSPNWKMKFGKHIERQRSEWAGSHYLNYKALKKIIKSAVAVNDQLQQQQSDSIDASQSQVNDNSTGNSADQSQEFQALKTAFFFRLERELEQINSFYLQKESEFKVRLRSLIDKKRIILSATNPTHAALLHLKEAFSQFQQDLAKLQKFVDTNAEGFRKILKKWDKRVKATTKELYLSRQVEIQPCFNNEVLTELNDLAAANLADLDQRLEGLEPEKTITKSSSLDAIVPNTTEDPVDDVETQFAMLFINGETSLIKEFLENRKIPSDQSASSLTAFDDKDFLSRVFLRVCTESTITCLEFLIESGEINYNYMDDITNRTCLHAAATSGRLDILQICVKNGGTVDIGDMYDRKPLHYAAMYGQDECAKFLIDSSANVDSIDHDGCSPLVYSIVNGHTKCVQMLIASGASIEPASSISPIPICLACQYGFLDMVTMLLSKGAQLLANADGLSPLHLTAREGHDLVSKLLIDHGADVDAHDGFNGWTPIFYAASEGKIDCVKVLIAAGSKIDLKDENNWLPWTYALHRGHIEVARLIAVPDGLTSFEIAESSESSSVLIATPTLGPKKIDESIVKPMAPSALFSSTVELKPTAIPEDLDSDMDMIPSLSLPPPIIPFRIYGHNYLEGKCYIQVTLTNVKSANGPSFTSPIHLFASRQLSSLKLVISSKPETNVPYSVILPQKDDFESFTFLVDDKDILDEKSSQVFALQFDIYPTFGTKLIGRAVALASHLRAVAGSSITGAVEAEKIVSPLFDQHLRVVGEFAFAFSIVKPFSHAGLKIGGGVDTYWKSTKVVETARQVSLGPSWMDMGSKYFQSFITASSLADEYIQIVVQVTSDGIPVVFPEWFMSLPKFNSEGDAEEDEIGLNINIPSITYAQAVALASMAGLKTKVHGIALAKSTQVSSQFGHRPSFVATQPLSNVEIARSLKRTFCSLEEVLQELPNDIGVSIEIKYPTTAEISYYGLKVLPDINTYVDNVLRVVYDVASNAQSALGQQRNIIFSSFNPSVCTAISWKQPNYGVFFASRCGYRPDGKRRRTPTGTSSSKTTGDIQIMSPRSLLFEKPGPTHSPGVVDGEPEKIETDRRCLSIKEAVRFAKSSNFLGVFCDARPLIQVPVLINTIKHSGLILATFGNANENPANVALQEENGVDVIIASSVLRTFQRI
ncbi:phosphate system positive regulatory protein pho81 [Nowakowskiella sp. JEL0407]|nr:phosphate system positive regulatory protein pho81 [Nowakowskiella sp. JEL0407]